MRDRIINIAAFIILSTLWLGFIAALIISPETLNNTWLWLRGLPLIVQAIVWLLILPVALGLWIWQTSWHIALRLILVLGLAWVTIYVFFPKRMPAPVAASAKP
jgi:hypothetical protein